MDRFSPPLLPFPPSGGRWREAPDEGVVPHVSFPTALTEAAPSSGSHPSGARHLLPQGEKEELNSY